MEQLLNSWDSWAGVDDAQPRWSARLFVPSTAAVLAAFQVRKFLAVNLPPVMAHTHDLS